MALSEELAKDNVFIKEVVKGKMVCINRLTVGHVFRAQGLGLEPHLIPAAVMASVTTIDNEQLTIDMLMEMDDFEIFNFISESITAMSKTKLF